MGDIRKKRTKNNHQRISYGESAVRKEEKIMKKGIERATLAREEDTRNALFWEVQGLTTQRRPGGIEKKEK